MPEPVILAIETSQREGAVALRDGGGQIHEEVLPPQSRHDVDLMPAVDGLFHRAGLAPRDLDAVGVSIGPGGFTGLRIAVSTAKMLAMALNAKIIAVPSALVVAENCPSEEVKDGPIMVALACKRGTFWSTTLRRRSGEWGIIGEPGLADAETIALENVVALIGDRHLPDAARQRAAASAVPIFQPRFDGRACLAVTVRMLAAGQTTDPLRLSPLYPRPPEAVSLWERRQKGRAESD
jgi:tRNA threonylcarbamoyl adenosine modification protein YeaZ